MVKTKRCGTYKLRYVLNLFTFHLRSVNAWNSVCVRVSVHTFMCDGVCVCARESEYIQYTSADSSKYPLTRTVLQRSQYFD